MNAITRLSSKGQVVLPKASRDKWQLAPGAEIEVIDTDDGMLLRPRRTTKRSFDEVKAALRKTIRYKGPVVTIEEMNQTIAEEWAKSGMRGDW